MYHDEDAIQPDRDRETPMLNEIIRTLNDALSSAQIHVEKASTHLMNAQYSYDDACTQRVMIQAALEAADPESVSQQTTGETKQTYRRQGDHD